MSTASFAFTDETNENIQASTRAAWKMSVTNQVFLSNPMLARMLMANKVIWRGGTELVFPVQKAEGDNMVQYYSATDGLDAKSKTYLTLVKFQWKHMQLPVMYGLDEEVKNSGGGDTKVFDLRKFLVDRAHDALRIALVNQMYGCDSSGARGTDNSLLSTEFVSAVDGDTAKPFQSATQALSHSAPYGSLTRTTTTVNPWWQGASMAGTYADFATAGTISPDFIAQMQDACMEHNGQYKPSDYLIVMGPALYRKLRQWVQAHKMDTGTGRLAKYGFDSFTWNGWEIAKDFRLQAKYISGITNAATTPAQNWVFCFCVPTWELRFHSKLGLKFTGFKWQGDVAGGRNEWLARIMASGNFICRQPGVNCWRNNIS